MLTIKGGFLNKRGLGEKFSIIFSPGWLPSLNWQNLADKMLQEMIHFADGGNGVKFHLLFCCACVGHDASVRCLGAIR